MAIGIQKKGINIADWLIILLVIVNSGFALTNGYDRILLLSECLLLALVFIKTINHQRISYIHKSIPVFAFSLIAALVLNFDFKAVSSYIQMMVVILIGWMVANYYDTRTINTVFIKIMRFMIVINTIVGIIQMLTGFITNFSLVLTNAYGKSYYSLILVNYDVSFATVSGRPSGIFWEPSIFSAFIALTALIDFFENKKRINKKYLALYLISFLVCGSTAGFVYLGLIIALILSVFSARKRGLVLSALIAGIVIVMITQYNNIVNYLVQLNPDLFLKLTYSNASLDSRLYSPLIDLVLMLKHPLGMGGSAYGPAYQAMADSYGVKATSRTSTVTALGACYGVLFFAAYVWLCLRRTIKNNPLESGLSKILSVVLFFLLLTVNPLYQNVFVWILIFSGANSCKRTEPALELLPQQKEELDFDEGALDN